MKRGKLFLLLVVLLAIVCVPVFADNKTEDNFIAGEEVTVNENIGKTAFIAGNNVKTTSEIEGLGFIAGNNVSISSYQDYLFAAGNNINISGATSKDVFVAGNVINVDSSKIRDLYAAGSNITINSDLEGSVYAGGNKVVINSIIKGDVTIEAEDITISEETVINGTLKYPEDAHINIASGAIITEQKTYKSLDKETIKVTPVTIIKRILFNFISKLIVAFIFFTLCKNLFKNIKKEEKTAGHLCKTSAIGLGLLILVPIVAIILLVTLIGLPVGIISLLLYGILIYLSSIVASYYVGTWVWKKKKTNEYLLLTCSLAAYYVLANLPVIRGLVVFLALILGLGIFFNQIVKSVKVNKE